MADSRFVYVTYIRTTPEKLWQALTEPEFTRKFWCNTVQESSWQPGASWRIMIPDGRVADSGEVVEAVPPKRLVLIWRNEFKPELREEGYSRLTYELEPIGETVKLTLIHEMDRPKSKLIDAVSQGWPHLMASLKSLLETGESLVETREWPQGVYTDAGRGLLLKDLVDGRRKVARLDPFRVRHHDHPGPFFGIDDQARARLVLGTIV